MIYIEMNEMEGIAIVRPEEMTGLTQADFQQVTDKIDAYLKDHDRLQGLVIVAEFFPGWEDFAAFTTHIKLIRDHQNSISKVAIVSDNPLLSAAPHVIDHFVNASVRHFALSDIQAAKVWAAEEEQRVGRFVILDDCPDDVVAIRAEGTITSRDYEEVLIPEIEKKIKAHGKVKMLYWCGNGFEGFSAGAMWDDARFGLTHLTDFSKIAFVSDVEWLRTSMKMFAPLMPAPVKVFHNAEIEEARKWIAES